MEDDTLGGVVMAIGFVILVVLVLFSFGVFD